MDAARERETVVVRLRDTDATTAAVEGQSGNLVNPMKVPGARRE